MSFVSFAHYYRTIVPNHTVGRTATNCRRDAADLYAELGDYTAAIERYKKVAESYMDSTLTRFNVKEIWLRQGLCALAMGDYTQASNLLTHTRNVDPTFQTTREAKFLSTLTDAFSAGDVEVSFRFLAHSTPSLLTYASFSRCSLTPWWNGITSPSWTTGRRAFYWPQSKSCRLTTTRHTDERIRRVSVLTALRAIPKMDLYFMPRSSEQLMATHFIPKID